MHEKVSLIKKLEMGQFWNVAQKIN